jgi:hypothetical protein
MKMKQKKLCKVSRTFGLRFLTATLLVIGNWLLLIGNCSLVIGQVAFGGDAPAADSGVNLRLDGSQGGLLLPQVKITSLTALPSTFLEVSSFDSVVGLLVYNTTAAVDASTAAPIPSGIYCWTGAATGWKLLAITN